MTFRKTVVAEQQQLRVRRRIAGDRSRERIDVVRLVEERRKDDEANVRILPREFPLDDFDRGRARRIGVMRIHRQQQQFIDAGRDQIGNAASDRRLAIAHREFDRNRHALRQRGAERFGMAQQRRSGRFPDALVRVCGSFGAKRKDESGDDDLANEPRRVDDVRIHQKLVQIAADVGDGGAGGRSEIDEQNAAVPHAVSLVDAKRWDSIRALFQSHER